MEILFCWQIISHLLISCGLSISLVESLLISIFGELQQFLHYILLISNLICYFYATCVLRNESIATFNDLLDQNVSPNDADVLHVMCCADEFENIRVRPEELDEMDRVKKESCPIKVSLITWILSLVFVCLTFEPVS